MSPVLHKLARSEKGFTLAEVIIAMVVFVASIVGISMMLMSGSGAVTRGAMENAATQLAQKKLEDIKTLPFYTPYTGANQDVDDFYFNTAYKNDQKDSQGNYLQLTATQPSNPTAYEDYGYISGYGKYKRTTAIQYIDPSNPSLGLTMETSPGTWVPKAATGNIVVPPQLDKPTDSSGNPVRMLLAVVTVYYHDPNSGAEVSYKAQSVVSDLMTTGGANNPVLVIKSINPTEGQLNNTNLQMNITVQSEGLTTADTLAVSLWYEGQTDNPATTVTVVSPTLISCNFNLSDHTGVTVRPGVYSLAVYWQNKGWKDTSFRNCFTVTVARPGFSTLTNHNWGHKGQSARPVVITGSNFQYATVNLQSQTNGTIIPAHGTTVSSDGTNINCTFDLTSISDVNTYWDIAITTRGGLTAVSETNANRLLVNPTPVITDIAAIDTDGGTYNWGHSGMTSRKVKFEGKYLYGFDSDVSTRQLIDGSYQTADATFVSGGTGNDCGDDTGAGNTGTLVLQYDLTTPSGATWNTPHSRWNPKLSNWGGQADISGDTQRFYMNPPAVITSIAATSSPNYYSWAHSGQNARNICITGNYLYGLQNTVVGNEKSLQYGNYSTTGAASLVSYTGDDSSPIGQNVVLTFNPSTASVGYNAVNSLWTVHLKNYGGVSESTTDATKVLFNPTPQITGITATASNYYNWATLGLGSRYVQVQGNYLYALNDSSALAQLSYGTNYTTDVGTGRLISGPTLNAEIGIGDAVTVNVQPSTAPIADKYSVPDSYWNVHLYNFGGTVDSNLNNAANLAVSVFMNPHPTVTTIVTGTSDTNWTYRAQTSRTVTITGTNLYSWNAGSPAAAKIGYGYGASATTYNYFNGTYTDPGCNFALNTSYSVTMTFNPSSGNYNGTGLTNGDYYELYLRNFGTPTAGYDTDPTGAPSGLGICMSPAPTTITDTLPATVTPGTAATIPVSGGGTKTTTCLLYT